MLLSYVFYQASQEGNSESLLFKYLNAEMFTNILKYDLGISNISEVLQRNIQTILCFCHPYVSHRK